MLFGEGEGILEVLAVVATLTVIVLVRVEGDLPVQDGTLLCVSSKSLGDSPASRSGTGVRCKDGELNTTCIVCVGMV